MTDCSIVIPVYDQAELTRRCLETLLSQPPKTVEFELIVVDDGSGEQTRAMLAEYAGRVRVVTHRTNEGFSRACNDGAATATGRWLVFLNNDTIPQPGWLDALVGYAVEHPQVGAVGAKLLYPDDTVQHVGVVIDPYSYPKHLYAGFPSWHPVVSRSRRFQAVTAACMLVQRELFDELGGFDTGFRNGYEDVDFCLRLGERGHEVHVCHEAVAYHLESVSEDRFSYSDENERLYRSRWIGRIHPDDFRYYVEDRLLGINYQYQYPLRVELSPLLGVVEGDEIDRRADRLLGHRARRNFEMLKEIVRLNARLLETERRSDLPAPIPEPRLVQEGCARWLSSTPAERLVSVLLPVTSRVEQLRELLERLVAQRSDDLLEIVAVLCDAGDSSLELLRDAQATIVAVDAPAPAGIPLADIVAPHVHGQVVVLLSESALPTDERWLTRLLAPLDDDEALSAVSSRLVPSEAGDPLSRRDLLRSPSASREAGDLTIDNVAAFHVLASAVRSDVLARFPLGSVSRPGARLWAASLLREGLRLRHEPSAAVFYSPHPSHVELLVESYQAGVGERESLVGSSANGLPQEELEQLLRDDWDYLEHELGLGGPELEHWRLEAALRRALEAVGCWAGRAGEMLGGVAATPRWVEEVGVGAAAAGLSAEKP